MSKETKTSGSTLKLVLGTVGVFAFFGFLTLILSGFVGHESLQDRTFEGEFDNETIETRWANLKEISEAQAGLIDEKKIGAAMAELAKAPSEPKKSELVVPGSPTFMKQSQQPAAEEAPAEEKPAAADQPEEEKAKPAPKAEAKPAEAPKAEEKPKAAPKEEAPKPKPAAKEKAAPKEKTKATPKAKEKAAPKEQPKAE